jgi:hypothetical protein
MSYSISIAADTVTPTLKAMIAQLSPQRFSAAVGPACMKLMQQNYRRQAPTKSGGKSTGFWADAARSTTWIPDGAGVILTTTKIGVRQQYYGGTIYPVNRKFLTVPIDPDAHGKTAADFPDAFLIITRKGAFICEHVNQFTPTGKQKKNAGPVLKFLFKLVASVDQAANPGVLPTDEEFYSVIFRAVDAALPK